MKAPRRARPVAKKTNAPQKRGRRPSALTTVSVPEGIRPLFLKAQDYVSRYFARKAENPTLGNISISGERYILVRAASMSVEFVDLVTSLYQDQGGTEARGVANNLLFDMGHAIGKADARAFHARMGVTDPIEKLSAGPIHFSFAGWAFVTIHPKSRPVPGDDYFLIYDHPYSFESDAWKRRGRQSESPVCIMNAGYSSGWCEESFGLPLVAAEIECLAAGGKRCRFIMAPPSRIEEHIAAHARHGRPATRGRSREVPVRVPEFFQRKRLEHELRRAYQDLERKVDERTAALLEANQRLRAEIAERERVEQELRASRQLLESIVDNSSAVIYLKDLAGKYLLVNRRYEDVIGTTRGELMGRTDYDLFGREQADAFRANDRRALLAGKAVDCEEAVPLEDGTHLFISSKFPMFDEKGEAWAVCGISTDITDRKRAEERVQYMAHHDALTGLPNRTLFQDRLGQALVQAHRKRHQVAVLFVDLDRFKDINDTLGHEAGDRLLRMAGRRFIGCLREGDSVARLGGDEFVICLPVLGTADDAILVASKVQESLREVFVVDGHELHVGASIGISLYPMDGETSDALMRAADTAMYHAKERGRDNYQFYLPALNEAAQQRLSLAGQLHLALQRDEFLLHYQPQVEMATGRVYSVEALVRWQPRGGRLRLPGEFIRVAEDIGLIVPLGERVLREACAQVRAWRAEGRADLRLAVNISPRQLRRAGFPALVASVLRETGLPAEALQLEITEGVLMAQNQDMPTLVELSELGVSLAVDDFGTRYSSLAYLRRFPIQVLKIDRSFVNGIGEDPNDTAIVTAILAMAEGLRLQVVAEGVETQGQAGFLGARGCPAAQGYLYGRPGPPDALATVLFGEKASR
jgi:diguanylate cyclase (GGDEF)-like protein/PAS domain S-box-containing protein